MKKFDIIIPVVALAAAGLLYASGVFSPKDEGDTAVIYVDNEEYARLPLDEETVLEVETEKGYNIVKIADGYADCIDADCRDSLCVNQQEISKLSETIVCLPHKMIVEIE